MEAGPVPQPRQPPGAVRHRRRGDLGADPGPRHPLRGRDRHGRHGHRDRPVPEGAQSRRGDHRGRPRGLGVLGGVGTALSGGGHRGGLLAFDLRPVGGGPGGGGLRRPELRHRPARDTPGGAPPRWVGGHRHRGRAGGRARPLPRRRHRRPHPRLGAGLSLQDLQRRLDGRLRVPAGGRDDRGRPARRRATRRSPRSSTPTPTRRSGRRSASCASTA